MSTVIKSMDRLFLFVLKVVLNYAMVFEQEYGVLFVKAHIKNAVDNMMLSRYPPKLSCLSYIR